MAQKANTASKSTSASRGGGGNNDAGLSAAPFFTMAIEGPNTAVALDAAGIEIVSLHFDDFNDLTSDSFREYATAAVAAVCGDLEPDVINLVDSDEINDELYMEDDLDEIFAAVLAENEAAALAAAVAAENLDADLALALRLQEEEEEKEKEEKRAANKIGGAWGTQNKNHPIFPAPPPPPTQASSFSATMGTAPGVSSALNSNSLHSNNRYKTLDSEFPSLPPPPLPPPPPASAGQHSVLENNISTCTRRTEKRVPLKTTLAAERSTGIRKVHMSSNSGTLVKEEVVNIDGMDACLSRPRHEQQQKFFDDLSTIEFLDSYDGEAIEARAAALSFIQTAATKEKQRENSNNNNNNTTNTREETKNMLGRNHYLQDSLGGRESNSVKSKERKGEQEEDEEDKYGGGYNRKKKIRTLVLSMIAAGWQFMPERRGSGHYIYQRFIPPTGHKQILVLPCTPSSQRSIDAVHARLQKMDREAAAVRAAAKKVGGVW